MAGKDGNGGLEVLRTLKVSNFTELTMYSYITVPLNHLRKIETDADSRNIKEILESISEAVDEKLLPSLDTISIIITTTCFEACPGSQGFASKGVSDLKWKLRNLGIRI